MNMTFNPSIRYRPSELIETMISSRTRFDDFMDFAGHQGVNEDVAKRVISKLRETYSFNSVQKQLQVARLLSNPNIPRVWLLTSPRKKVTFVPWILTLSW